MTERKIDISKEVLVAKIEEGLSQKAIGTSLGYSQTTIRYWLNKFDLTTQTSPGPNPHTIQYCPHCKNKTKYGRMFCNAVCRTEYNYILNVNAWLADPLQLNSYHIPTYVRKYLYRTRGEQCELCQWSKVNPHTKRIPLEIHHIDGTSNPDPSNLQILCPSCHALTETFRNAGGKNRKGRRSKEK